MTNLYILGNITLPNFGSPNKGADVWMEEDGAVLQEEGTIFVGELCFAHEDERRRIEEVLLPGGGSVQQFQISPERDTLILGNHYHQDNEREFTEVFVILEGGGTFFGSDADSSAVTETEIGPGSVIRVPQNHTHTFILRGGSRMLCVSTGRLVASGEDKNTFEDVIVDKETGKPV